MKIDTPLLRCISIVVLAVCCAVGIARCDEVALTPPAKTPTWVAPNNIDLPCAENCLHLAISGERLRNSGSGPIGSTLGQYSLVAYEIPGMSLIDGGAAAFSGSNIINQIGTTTTRPATASEGSTLTMLLISALCIALIILRRRRSGTGRSQDGNSSDSSAREDHPTTSYEAHSPMIASDHTSGSACRQHPVRRDGSCFRN